MKLREESTKINLIFVCASCKGKTKENLEKLIKIYKKGNPTKEIKQFIENVVNSFYEHGVSEESSTRVLEIIRNQ